MNLPSKLSTDLKKLHYLKNELEVGTVAIIILCFKEIIIKFAFLVDDLPYLSILFIAMILLACEFFHAFVCKFFCNIVNFYTTTSKERMVLDV